MCRLRNKAMHDYTLTERQTLDKVIPMWHSSSLVPQKNLLSQQLLRQGVGRHDQIYSQLLNRIFCTLMCTLMDAKCIFPAFRMCFPYTLVHTNYML